MRTLSPKVSCPRSHLSIRDRQGLELRSSATLVSAPGRSSPRAEVAPKEKQTSSNKGPLSLSPSLKEGKVQPKPGVGRSGELPQFPRGKAATRPRYRTGSPRARPSTSARPALPDSTLETRQATIENCSCTHKDSHQQRHVPQQPFPGEEWPSGIPAATTPSLPPGVFAGRETAAAAQAHRGGARALASTPPRCARGCRARSAPPPPPWASSPGSTSQWL